MNQKQLNEYISLRYYNWLDYAKHMARVHHFNGWEHDLLNDVIEDLLKKPLPFICEMLNKSTRKIINGVPTTELDKYVLKMLQINASSDTAPFRKNTLGYKITGTSNGQPEVIKTIQFKHQEPTQTEYNPEIRARLRNMHARNIKNMRRNYFNTKAIEVYRLHFIESVPLCELTPIQKSYVEHIINFLQQNKHTVFDS